MNKIDRYKIFIRHLVKCGVVANQKELGRLMGYMNESAFSQIINQKTPEPKDFIKRLLAIYPDLDSNWLQTGEGEMLKSSSIDQEIHGSNNTSVAGYANTVNSSSTIERAIGEIAEMRKLVQKRDEQIDRLISIIEQMNNK